MPRVLLALVLLPLLAISAPVPKSLKAVNYFPLRVGDRWVYEQNGMEVVEEVSTVSERDGEVRVVIDVAKGDGTDWAVEYVVAGGTVYHAKTWVATFDPPIRMLELDLRAGAKWVSTIPPTKEGGVGHAASGEMAVGEAEEVDVPAGRFRAVPVTWTKTEEGGNPLAKPKVSVYWYVAGIGLVKTKNDGGEKVLKEFTPAKDAKK